MENKQKSINLDFKRSFAPILIQKLSKLIQTEIQKFEEIGPTVIKGKKLNWENVIDKSLMHSFCKANLNPLNL